MGSPSASLTSRSAPARYPQYGSCPSYGFRLGATLPRLQAQRVGSSRKVMPSSSRRRTASMKCSVPMTIEA